MNSTKFIIAFSFFCTLCITDLYSTDSQSNLVPPTKKIIKEYQYKVAFAKIVQQVQDFCPILTDVLHELLLHTDYWKTQQLTPFSYFLSKDPTKWIYRKQEWQKIDSCIEFLNKEQEHTAYYIGLFRQFLQKSSYSVQQLNELLAMLESCLSHYPCEEITKNNISMDDIEQRVDRNDCLIKRYKKNAQYAVAHCSKPNHFQRNWLGYFLGTTAAVGLSYFLFKNKANIQNWAHLTVGAVKNFWDEHISSPIANSLRILLRRDREPIMTKKGLRSSEESLANQIKTYCITNHSKISDVEVERIIAESKKGNMPEILSEWDRLWQFVFGDDDKSQNFTITHDIKNTMEWLNWAKGLLGGGQKELDSIKKEDSERISKIINEILLISEKVPEAKKLLQLIDIRVQAKEVMINKIMLEVENQINANRLNFELTAVLPTALMVYITYTIGKKLFTNIVLQKHTYQPLRKALRNMHKIYNNYLITNNDLTIVDQGYCYYWLDQCKKHISQISLDQQKMILEDLAELESTTYKPNQKLLIIQRMYYNYHFLLPSDN